MQPYYERSGIRLYHGDAADVLPTLDAESISAVVSDPPAGIAFMSKSWDRDRGGRDQWVAWLASILSECNRTMKPGAHAVIWALPRTSGWTHRAIEDAGLDVRDCVTHLFGSGFPKSHNLPGGLGTALKPAAEFWYLARKPLSGTVAANVLEHGTGAINIDACRVGASGGTKAVDFNGPRGNGVYGNGEGSYRNGIAEIGAGRWPPNVLLDETAAAQLDQMSGERRNGGQNATSKGAPGMFGVGAAGGIGATRFAGDTGGASRFFYCAKSSRRERTANGTVPNGHATVKPLALMRWLVTLVTPPGGVVLDPFAGSGTTGVAAAALGIPCVLIEQEAEYLPIIAGRIDHALNERTGAELPLFAGVAD